MVRGLMLDIEAARKNPFTAGLFTGKVALVTGGGTGIGRATALELAALGCKVAICGRKLDKLEPTIAELGALTHADGAMGETCDIREPEQVARLVDAVLARFGRIDVLVNNAGGQFPSPAMHITPRGWEAVIRNNLNGTFFMTREVATRAMIPQTSGAIVNVTANAARGFPGMAHTGAARAGVENLTHTLAIEWAPFDIRVNAVAPGIVRSSGTAQYPPELVEMSRTRTPQKRTATVEEIAHSIVYLASPAAQFVTGAILRIDGGASLWGDNWDLPERSDDLR